MQNPSDIKKGGISVDTEHIFPIIKKWLYSEKDIFLREIVSNAADAITKLKRLSSLGIRSSDESYSINVTLDSENQTLTVEDNGIGMTEEELLKYICNIALSGAVEFIQKYENENDASKNGIIGHFGLGFYSSLMVSNKVEIITKSYTDAPAVHWVCSDEGQYEINTAEKEAHGTAVIMHISDDEKEYLSTSKIRAILEKYCSFIGVPIYYTDDTKEEAELINDTEPLWLKPASECTNDDYKSFYSKVFTDFKEPLFEVHINADYPLNFKGILYFPKFTNDYEATEGQVKLYYNQVFVADNIKEVIPEYLFMLKGVLDCPELPLNVSRSYLQKNNYVSKVSAHIVKKLADKINSLKNNEAERYSQIWDDISSFVEYACMRDKKFYDRVKNSLLLTLTDSTKVSFNDYLEAAKDKHDNTIFYATDKAMQAQYIAMLEEQGVKVALLDKTIDTQFATFVEQYLEGVKFVRVDSEISDILKADGAIEENVDLRDLFIKVSNNNKLTVKFDYLKSKDIPALLNIDEQSRRMEEMMRLYNMGDSNEAFTSQPTLVINTNSSLIQKLTETVKEDAPKAEKIASYIYKVTLLSQKKLSADEMNDFINDSFNILLNF